MKDARAKTFPRSILAGVRMVATDSLDLIPKGRCQSTLLGRSLSIDEAHQKMAVADR